MGPTRFPSAPSLQVDRVLDPETPVFLVAREDGAHEALALLAAKDSAGNARAITGVAFVAGDDYLSVEYDTQGRPERLTSPSVVLRLFDYDAASVTLQTTDANGDTTTERISFEREELDALRVALPSAADLSLVSAAAEPAPPIAAIVTQSCATKPARTVTKYCSAGAFPMCAKPSARRSSWAWQAIARAPPSIWSSSAAPTLARRSTSAAKRPTEAPCARRNATLRTAAVRQTDGAGARVSIRSAVITASRPHGRVAATAGNVSQSGPR